ncbi:MAG TPA: zinc-binding dehydrogenase [Acidimicrobiales bacterium]|nr:zinc-binding dehydrogenase [Acidimicrobiales bacterium]
MHAVVIAAGALHWSERPDPAPGTAELLVEVHAAGVNRADLLQQAGRYPPPPGVPPDQPGLECAGVVTAVGPATRRFAPGDRVMGLLGGAAQGELAVIHERIAMPVPAGVDLAEAGGFCEAFATAHDALFTQCALAPGDRLLVSGAAGGVGIAAVQLGHATGATVVASVRDPARREAVAGFGAVSVAPDEVAAHGPFDVVIELVGGSQVAADLEALAPGGRIVVIGTGAGGTTELDLHLLMARSASIRASTLRARPLEEKALVSRALERHVLPLLATGKVRVPVERRFEFADAPAAYERFAAGAKLGKIVLVR